MHADAVFEQEGERFLPGRAAIGPWSAELLHGGPVLGLIARAAEAGLQDPELVLTRLSVDMFRPVPAAPLALAVETLRKGSRLVLLRITVSGDAGALAQGTALLLRASAATAAPGEPLAGSTPLSPDGLTSESLMRGAQRNPDRPAGFHTRVETRWVPRSSGQPLAIWFRLPIALVAGEPTSALVSAVALSDFANAIAAIAAAERGAGAPYINADTTLYLARRPEGEWFCLQEHACEAERGISTAEVRLFDRRGALGRALQARLLVR